MVLGFDFLLYVVGVQGKTNGVWFRLFKWGLRFWGVLSTFESFIRI